jgi:hypothetical protein
VDLDRSTQTFVHDAHASATRMPVDPRTTDREGLAAAAEATNAGELEVQLDGHPVTVRASVASARHVVGTAYLIGGFELVRSLHNEVRQRVKIETLTLSQQRAAIQTLPGEARGRLRQSAIDRDVADLKSQVLSTERRLRTATELQHMIGDAWARIAVAEEEVLRAYEPRLISQFVALTKDAQTIALQEWARYEPYDTSATDPTPLTTSEAKERALDDLRLRKEAHDLVAAVRTLHTRWTDYLDAAYSTSRLAALGARRIRLASPDEDPARLFANSRANTAAKFHEFDVCRSDVGTRFPVALQVYVRLGTLAASDVKTTDAKIEAWVVESLYQANDSAQELGYNAVKNQLFKAGARMRVESTDPPDARADLPSYQQDLLERGLTVPASRVIGNRMAVADEAVKSPWFQLSAKLSLFRRGVEGDEFLAPYATPGRLHHAALSELNNALQEVRRNQKQALDRALLIMDALALPAGFFTGGATLAIAGVIHAVVRSNEMYLDLKEFQDRDALAQVALTPIQQAVWEHPSAVTLTGKLLENGFEIASDLVNTGIAGAIMDAIQVSLTIGYGAEAVAEWVAADDPLEDE